MNRAPLTFTFRDGVLVGTMHVPPEESAENRDRIGLLLLNGGPVPRAGSGDLSAYLCDRLAERGVAGFRFDLAGLGDSTGPSWREGDTFWRAGLRGFNDAAVVALVEHLCDRFGLRGVMIGGLCAGGVLSLRGARGLPEHLLGLVLLEPDLRTPPPKSRREKFERLVSRIHSFVARSKMPADTQKETVSIWRRLTTRGVPSLLVVAQGKEVERYAGFAVETFPMEKRAAVRVARIPNSNHILLADDSPQRTGDALCAWVAELFPRAVVPEGRTVNRPDRDSPAARDDDDHEEFSAVAR